MTAIERRRERALLSDTYKLDMSHAEVIGKMRGGEGYDRMSERKSWKAVASWGRDGWDLGDWPLVVVSHRDNELNSLGETFDLLTDVEGDLSAWRYPTRELRDMATDIIAFFYWKAHSEDWVDGIDHAYLLPPKLRGPYSPERADREKAEEERTAMLWRQDARP